MTPFPFQRGQVGLTRRLSAAQNIGLLQQFDVESSGQVVADIGPNSALAGTNALDGSVVKWGSNSLNMISGEPAVDTVSAVVNDLASKSWRFEFWVYWVTNSATANIDFRTSSNSRGVAIGRRSTLGAYVYSTSSAVGSASGHTGANADRAPLNTWVHVAVEQEVGQLVKVYDSHKNGFVGNVGPTIHTMDTTCFGRLRLGTVLGTYYIDSFRFKWFEPSEADQLFAVSGYSVPTGPFT